MSTHKGSDDIPPEKEFPKEVSHEELECECCKDPEGFRKRQKEAMAKYGWVCHAVYGKNCHPCGANCHTHGISDTWNHLDFQVVLPIEMEIVHGIFARFVDKIKDGERFEDGDVVKEIIGNDMPVKLIAAAEGDRNVLRIILPDATGNLGPFFDDLMYAPQYDEFDHED